MSLNKRRAPISKRCHQNLYSVGNILKWSPTSPCHEHDCSQLLKVKTIASIRLEIEIKNLQSGRWKICARRKYSSSCYWFLFWSRIFWKIQTSIRFLLSTLLLAFVFAIVFWLFFHFFHAILLCLLPNHFEKLIKTMYIRGW